jgi:hypothetical protein
MLGKLKLVWACRCKAASAGTPEDIECPPPHWPSLPPSASPLRLHYLGSLAIAGCGGVEDSRRGGQQSSGTGLLSMIIIFLSHPVNPMFVW